MGRWETTGVDPVVSSFHGFVVVAAALAVLLIRAQDPVKVDAKHYKAEVENDHVCAVKIPGLASMRDAHCDRLLNRISGEFHQPIADGRFGDYQLRLRRVVFDLFAQMRDMNAKVMCLLDRLHSPNLREKLAVR